MSSDPLIRFRCASIRRSGATDIRVIHAGSADTARERLIAAGLEPVTIVPVGPSLANRLATRLHERLQVFRDREARNTTPAAYPKPLSMLLLTTACLLATASITLLLASWTLVLATMWRSDQLLSEKAAPIARYQDQISDELTRKAARTAMTSPGPTEILGRLAAILPSDTGLVAAARDEKGTLRIELDTSDPDQIRPIFASDPIFRSLKEIGQTQTNEGTIRVTWASAPS